MPQKLSPTQALDYTIAQLGPWFDKWKTRPGKRGVPGEVVQAQKPETRAALARLTSDMIARPMRRDEILFLCWKPHWREAALSAEQLRALDERLIRRHAHFYGPVGS